jgi:hypothetical protein
MAINMTRIAHVVVIALAILLTHGSSLAKDTSRKPGETIKSVQAEGSCAIVGMSAEQSQLLALQRARAAAIEQAAGVSVSSSTLVTNYIVAVDFIKTYSRGFIIKEKVAWLPLGQYQKDSSVAPIPEYRVRIIADVYVPRRMKASISLKAKLNNTIFREGEKVRIAVSTAREAKIAVFNIMADDTIAMLFPNSYEINNTISPKNEWVFPTADSKVEIEMHTMTGHEKDAEAIFVVAVNRLQNVEFMDIFSTAEPMSFSEFFKKLSQIADYSEDVILPYEVIGAEK